MTEDVFGIVGTVVGGAFNVEAVVAEGGFAVVYRAYHGAFHAPVALKCLKVPTVSRTSQRDFLERFREEGEVMFRLSQSIPSVVRPLHIDAFETPNGVFVPYMALEWLEGESLDVIIAQRAAEGRPPMALKPAIRLLSPVARALARAHRFPGPSGPVSIVHRDLKPDNIVVASINGEEVVKILDFGIAKVRSVASQAAGRVSHEGGQIAVPFTPGYAAPEQWFPKRFGQTGPWTDVWGLALTMTETLSGKAAIDGDHAAMMGTAIDEKRRPTPRTEGAKISDEVEAVFVRALSVDPRARFRDVGEFWDALERAAGMQRSMTPATGFTPQPHRDPRRDGEPTAMEEVIEAAADEQRLSLRSPAPRKASTPPASRTPPAVPEVPDLELAVDPQIAIKAEHARRAESTAKMRALNADDIPALLDKPQGVRASSSGQQPAVVMTAADAEAATAPRRAPSGAFEISGLDPSAAGPASGLDLAVSPSDVRKASQHKMQAVNLAQLEEAGMIPPASRSGQHRAVSSASPAPPAAETRPASAAARPAAAEGAAKPAAGPAPRPLIPEQYRKFVLPAALIAVGLVIVIGFYINAVSGGGKANLFGVPINWIAGIFVVAGTGLLLFRVFVRED